MATASRQFYKLVKKGREKAIFPQELQLVVLGGDVVDDMMMGDDLLDSSGVVMEAFDEDMAHFRDYGELPRTHSFAAAATVQVPGGAFLCVVGGLCNDEECGSHIDIFDLKARAWLPEAVLPEMPGFDEEHSELSSSDDEEHDGARQRHCCVAYGTELYVIGGSQEPDDKQLASMISLDLSRARDSPPELEWRVRPSMEFARSDFAAAVLGDKLYVTGGHIEEPLEGNDLDGLPVTATMEIYDFGLEEWQALEDAAHMQRVRAFHGMAATNGCLYVSGGIGTETHRSMEKYDPTAKQPQWVEMRHMRHPMEEVQLAVLSDPNFVFAVGRAVVNLGLHRDTEVQSEEEEESLLEVYDVARDHWEAVASSEGSNGFRQSDAYCVVVV